jgi:DtxR family Mn-dependent transcriptional regulator
VKDVDTPVSASLEDYVETIYQILQDKQAVRAKDIADRMEVKRPSVTGALQALTRSGLVSHSPYDVITLTEKGQTLAREVLRRHEVLQEFLVDLLGIPVKEAAVTACSLEHSVSRQVVDRLVKLMQFVKASPGIMNQWKGKRARPPAHGVCRNGHDETGKPAVDNQ